MEIVFDLRGERFPLDERQATILGEELRRAAAGQLGEYGIEGALAVADKIEDVHVGRSDAVAIEGTDEEEALYYGLNAGTGASSPDSQERTLYEAVRPLHEARLRDEGGSAPFS